VTTWWLVGPLARARGWPHWYAAGLAIPLVFLIEPTRETITFGQINMLLIVLIVGDLLFAVPRNWRLAGAGIGLATALKLFPGIFIVYLLVTRRWRAAVVASATAAGATLLAAAIAPRASWQFWTDALWSTDRVGRTDYTGNQSLQGLLARLTAPAEPPRLAWLLLVAAVAGFGLWRAVRAARAGDELTGMALTGLVAALISPITWPHHVYWFVPAVLALVTAASAPVGRRRRSALVALAIGGYATAAVGVVSFVDFGTAPEPTDSVREFLLRNAYVLAAVVLLATLPAHTRSASDKTDLPTEPV
jgi:alpha-1,2-mannosyltransferase